MVEKDIRLDNLATIMSDVIDGSVIENTFLSAAVVLLS